MTKPVIRNRTQPKPPNDPEIEEVTEEEEEVIEAITVDSDQEDCGCPEGAEENCLSVSCPRE
jgi:hypothetical protein